MRIDGCVLPFQIIAYCFQQGLRALVTSGPGLQPKQPLGRSGLKEVELNSGSRLKSRAGQDRNEERGQDRFILKIVAIRTF
ncbi:hypothetical protein EVAR_99856_1 [Eumeta japonica]|uniref:Uncharacterized protein n=1 Tax=Eumeta variegata TaxID=151549 RepID=A0A4C1ZKQ9_EUMVA|nr:hypothetical protein EVAR_99856_1 [Eumeta japonica]